MMTREQIKKAWINAQEINYNGSKLLVLQGLDRAGYAIFGYGKTFVLFIGHHENVHKTVSAAKQAISGNLMHRYSGPDPCAIQRAMKKLNAALLKNERAQA